MIACLKLWLTRRRASRVARFALEQQRKRMADRIIAGSMVERARQWEGATYE